MTYAPVPTQSKWKYRFAKWTPKWSDLNKLGKSKILRSSYLWLILVPVSAKLLAPLQDVVQLQVLGSEWTFDLGLPFSWKVFFFASIAFSGASLLYSLMCPNLIRDYETFPDFKNEGKGNKQIISAFKRINLPVGNVEAFLRNCCGIERHFEGNGLLARVRWESEVLDTAQVNDLAQAFWYVHEHSDVQSMGTRRACALLYASGFLMLGWVFGENVLFVIRFG